MSIGRYRIERRIAAGGMGAIYLGVQPEIGARVAIKVLSDRCAANPELVERFFSEARAVNLIKHESIVNVLDMSNLPDGRPYLVMEYIDGQTLGHIARRTRPPLGGIARAVGEALSALAAAHAIGIIHRDLKPDNILITAKGHAKLLDFGIAKLARGLAHEHAPRTYTDDFFGTPAYMSPEQIASPAAVDARSDLYAIGVVLYEAVTGRTPFSGSTFDLMRAHVSEPPPPPRALRPELPAAFEAVILTALAKDPTHRFASAAAMGTALATVARELPPAQQASLAPIVETAEPGVETPAAPSAAPPSAAPPAAISPARPSTARRRWPWLLGAVLLAAAATPIAIIAGRRDAPATPRVLAPMTIRDPAHFDIQPLLPIALDHARSIAADAQLVEVQLHPLGKGGLVELPRRGAIENRIVFVSPTAKPCAIVMVLTEHGVTVERRDEMCSMRPVRLPRCRIGQLFETKLASMVEEAIGVPAVREFLTTSIRYTGTPRGPQWHVTALASADDIADDCEIGDTNGP